MPQGHLRDAARPEATMTPARSVDGLTRHFGGLRAVEDVSLRRRRRRASSASSDPTARARRRCSRWSPAQLAARRPAACVFDGQDITGWPAHRVAAGRAGPHLPADAAVRVDVGARQRRRRLAHPRPVAHGGPRPRPRGPRAGAARRRRPARHRQPDHGRPQAARAGPGAGHASRGCCSSTRSSPGWCPPSGSR